jgi:hypothetical protein
MTTPAKKAWKTMKSKSPGIKANYTKRRKEGAKKSAKKVKGKQWEPEKIKYLSELKKDSKPNVCIVCRDNRPIVLQEHHLEPDKNCVVKLCANCHDIVRRGKLDDLMKAHNDRKISRNQSIRQLTTGYAVSETPAERV